MKRKRAALTLTEIIVSALIFSAVVAGFLSVVMSVGRLNTRSRQRIHGMNVARMVMEELYYEVREDTWSSGNLTLGDHNNYVVVPIENVNYTVDYTVSALGGAPRSIQIDVTVKWPRQE